MSSIPPTFLNLPVSSKGIACHCSLPLGHWGQPKNTQKKPLRITLFAGSLWHPCVILLAFLDQCGQKVPKVCTSVFFLANIMPSATLLLGGGDPEAEVTALPLPCVMAGRSCYTSCVKSRTCEGPCQGFVIEQYFHLPNHCTMLHISQKCSHAVILVLLYKYHKNNLNRE